MRRKFFSALLAMAMVLTLAPATAWAETGDVTITPETKSASYGTANVEFSVGVEEGNNDSKTTVTIAVTADSDSSSVSDVAPATLSVGADAVTLTVNTSSLSVGAYTVTATAGGKSDTAAITITKADQAAPTGLGVSAPAAADGKGKITGTTTAMEYKLKSAADSTYAACSASNTEVDPGTYVVRLKEDPNHNAGTASSDLVVPEFQATTEIVAVTGVTLNKSTISIEVGGTETLTATVAPANATTKTVTWSSSDTTKATVDSDGKVTGVAEGSATITVKSNADNTKTASCTVTVTAATKVATPTFSPAAGAVTSGTTVTISCTTPGATIYYTTDGSNPTAEGGTAYSTAISITEAKTIKAIAVKEDLTGSEVATAAYTISTGSGSGSGSGSSSSGSDNSSSSSGGSGSGGSGSTVSVPVSGYENSVEVSAKVSGSTATIEKIDNLDKVVGGDVETGIVSIDLSSLSKSVDTVSISTNVFEDIADAASSRSNDVDGLAIKMDTGIVTFDTDALEAIVDQASGSNIELKFDKTTTNSLSSTQKAAVKDMDVHGTYSLTLSSGKAITNFKGGEVTVQIAFSIPSGKEASGFVVLHVASDGEVERMRTSYSGGYLRFTTGHFSDYVIAYEEAPAEPEEPEETEAPASKVEVNFTDVPDDMWYSAAVAFVVENGLMGGVGNGEFAPNLSLSRAMLAQILYNHEGRPAVGAPDFTDVESGMWYTDAIAWAAANNVVTGYGDGRFGPQDNIKREQLAAMLYRYAGSPAAEGSLDSFVDAGEASEYAQNALVWATTNGVMGGKGAGKLDPQGMATRAEVAQMLSNYLGK